MKVAFSIVTYKERFWETNAFKSLMHSIEVSKCKNTFRVYIFDNTDLPKWKIDFHLQVFSVELLYFHDSSNPGISVAYNFVAKHAQGLGIEWMVFFDQDTTISTDAVDIYLANAIDCQTIKVPVLSNKGMIYSPMRHVLKKTIHVRKIVPGIYQYANYAFVNSGLMVNLNFYFELGGYNESIRVDFTDFQFIERVRTRSEKFKVLPLIFQHECSHDERDVEKALSRYRLFVKDWKVCERRKLTDSIGYFVIDILHLARLTIRFRTLRFVLTNLQVKRQKN